MRLVKQSVSEPIEGGDADRGRLVVHGTEGMRVGRTWLVREEMSALTMMEEALRENCQDSLCSN